METNRLIKVLVVDDSAFMRKTISNILNQAPDIEVVATARDGLDGVQKVTDYRPDVVTLDIEMPKLQGLDALGYIMSECPTPVVMLSAYTERGGEMTMKALEYGAVDFICKPSGPISLDLGKISEDLVNKVRTAAQVDVSKIKFIEFDKFQKKSEPVKVPVTGQCAVVIASSTGGPRALYEVIPKLPGDLPAPVLIVQHMSAGFTKSMAMRLNKISNLPVKEAESGDEILAGHVYIAPTNYHMVIDQVQGKKIVKLHQGPARNSVRPAADETFESAADVYGSRCLAVVLTGMGRDGTQGSIKLKKQGAVILAEDESTCVVYGMPRAVVDAGVVDNVYGLFDMSEKIIQHIASLKSY